MRIQDIMENIDNTARYQKLTAIISKETNLDIPVVYNYNGSTSFGMQHALTDTNEFDWIYTTGSVELIDVIEQKHMKYFAVQLRNSLVTNEDESWFYDITEEILNKHGIKMKLTASQLEAYIILHEFGHADELYNKYNKDVVSYYTEHYTKNQELNYQEKLAGHGTKEAWLIHKSKETEQYADNFACKWLTHILAIVETQV